MRNINIISFIISIFIFILINFGYTNAMNYISQINEIKKTNVNQKVKNIENIKIISKFDLKKLTWNYLKYIIFIFKSTKMKEV